MEVRVGGGLYCRSFVQLQKPSIVGELLCYDISKWFLDLTSLEMLVTRLKNLKK